jgi:drug/metabolite transporter (DMT)-like permease
MTFSSQFVSTSYSVASFFAWGVSDFLGGYASRTIDAFLITLMVNVGGLVFMVALAAATHAAPLSWQSIAWVIAGGALGSGALAIFYRSLAMGRMGLTAPIAAVLGAGIPTIFSMITEGMPSSLHIAGFVLAGAGIWLISRTERGTENKGLGTAVIAGIGFAGFYLCLRQAGQGSPLWIASFSRVGGLSVIFVIVALQKKFGRISAPAVGWGLVTGCLDSLGTALFAGASQSGRLDAAVVLSSLYPAVTVLLAWLFLHEHFTRWRTLGILSALAAVPMIAS